MSGHITIEKAGLLSTIQDRGRYSLRHLGIPWSGCLTPVWQQLANALVGNPANNSVLECFEGGLQLRVGNAGARLAVMAHPTVKLTVSSQHAGPTTLVPARSYTLPPESILTLIGTGEWRHAIIAFAGLQVDHQLNSTSTYAKASLGGIDGRALRPGDTLPVSDVIHGAEQHCVDPLLAHYAGTQLRVVLGPQDDHFSATGKALFLSGDYELTSEADRMGVRLEGPVIQHRDTAARDIVSDAIVPGSIQVPGTGQPIVLLNDAHTAGGYPKIATVLSIDLPLLGLQRPGAHFTFHALDIDQAIHAIRHQHQQVTNTLAAISPITNPAPTTKHLLTQNLIDGVTTGSDHHN